MQTLLRSIHQVTMTSTIAIKPAAGTVQSVLSSIQQGNDCNDTCAQQQTRSSQSSTCVPEGCLLLQAGSSTRTMGDAGVVLYEAALMLGPTLNKRA